MVEAKPPLSGRTIALCISGGIAAYKAVIVARLLVQAGAKVLPILTTSGAKFVGRVTLSGICGEGVLEDMWDPRFAGEAHVVIADRADLVVIVPCTADLLARMGEGRADDLVGALALVARSPIVAAPAMHPRMWSHPATQRNVDVLRRDGRVTFVGPVHGVVASGDVGLGRMSEPDEIVAAAIDALSAKTVAQPIDAKKSPDLRGRHVVVTAGPTVEDVDPVRFLGNRSTGKMGFAVASAAAARGARVTLIAGPVSLPTPTGVVRVDVRGALEMQRVLDQTLGTTLDGADVLVMTAAVADYRPAVVSSEKSKKAGDKITLELVKNPDLLAAIGARRGDRPSPVLVGFAVETDNLIEYARRKLTEKRVDFVVANLAAHGFGGDDDEVVIVGSTSERPMRASKRQIAEAVLDEVAGRL